MVSDAGPTRPKPVPTEDLPPALRDKLESLPSAPGVYVFRDSAERTLYVGKATSLRQRVRSYFQKGAADTRAYLPVMLRHVVDIETIVTRTEKEATILEASLVRQHKPRYNVKLRDDKEYLCLRLDATADWPRLELVRRPAPDGARYFGPFHSATSARRTLHVVNKHFQLRTCRDADFAARTRPCLQFQIKRCAAPCVREVHRGWYDEQVQAVILFLDGRHDELTSVLEGRMHAAAAKMQFELASAYRDQLRALARVRETQRVVAEDFLDRDVVGLHRKDDAVCIVLLHIRGGRLMDVGSFFLRHVDVADDEVLATFLSSHYHLLSSEGDPASDGGARTESYAGLPIPPEIIIPIAPEGMAGLEELLCDRVGKKVRLIVPARGPRLPLLALAQENAAHAWADRQKRAVDLESRLLDIQRRLRLPSLPRRIECCDISHLGGSDTAGAVVAMKDGLLDKSRYRSFRVSIAPTAGEHGGNNDYASMSEVLRRRFARAAEALREEDESAESRSPAETSVDAADEAWSLPDLFVVDGGRGQLGVALAAARDLGLHELSIVGLAKERESLDSEIISDRIYLPGQKNPIPIQASSGLILLARLRDEAHRASNLLRERMGLRREFRSGLDGIRGVGPKAKKALLTHFSRIESISVADLGALEAVPGLTRAQALAVYTYFRGEVTEPEVAAPDAGVNPSTT